MAASDRLLARIKMRERGVAEVIRVGGVDEDGEFFIRYMSSSGFEDDMIDERECHH